MTTISCCRVATMASRRAAQNLLGCLLASMMGLLAEPGWAQEVLFNSAFLPEGSESLDLAPFQSGNVVLPGEYRADVFINGRPAGRKSIRFAPRADGEVIACFSRSLLEALGVDPRAMAGRSGDSGAVSQECLALPETVQDGRVEFNLQSQALRVSIPQVAMRRDVRGYVDPQLWNPGTTAATLGYSANTTRNLQGNLEDSAYLGFDAGLNLGDWRLRHRASASWQANSGSSYQDLGTYVQRDLASLKSQLTLGETHTTGELFDTLAYRGVQLATDDRMLPQSLRGYAPLIRGIARTSARVVVRQGGSILLETLVAPGAFLIDDLYSNGYGGDLEVTVNEADGSQQRFSVPYASVTQLLRPGVSRFSLTLGELSSDFLERPPRFAQATFQRGLNSIFTGEGGLQVSDQYQALLTGVAANTPWGALALDLTQSRFQAPGGVESGESLRLLYNKSLVSTGSYLTAASYWYSASGARDLNDAAQRLQFEESAFSGLRPPQVSNRQAITVNQRVGNWGQLGLSAFSQRYRNVAGRDLQYQLSYGTQVGRVGLTLNGNRSRLASGAMETSYLLSASIALEFGARDRISQLALRLGRDARGQLNQELYLSGSVGENNPFSYGVGAQRDGAEATTATSLYGQYQGARSNVGGSLSQGDGYSSLGLSASGSLVGHPNGLTLSPFRSETIAVVSAPGAQGAQVTGYPGVTLDGQGNAIVPYLRPYEFNEVGIDPRGSSMEVELNESSRNVAPTAGAVLAIDFATQTGYALLLVVHLEDGSPLPFGASVNLLSGQSLGLVGQGGQLYARVPPQTGQLLISWGREPHQRCVLSVPALGRDTQAPTSKDSVCTPVQQVPGMG